MLQIKLLFPPRIYQTNARFSWVQRSEYKNEMFLEHSALFQPRGQTTSKNCVLRNRMPVLSFRLEVCLCARVCWDEAPVGRPLPAAHPAPPARSRHLAGQPRSVPPPHINTWIQINIITQDKWVSHVRRSKLYVNINVFVRGVQRRSRWNGFHFLPPPRFHFQNKTTEITFYIVIKLLFYFLSVYKNTNRHEVMMTGLFSFFLS